MQGYGKVWVLISEHQIGKAYRSLDKVEVGTWSHGYDKMLGYRNYVILDEKGNLMAYDTNGFL